jgi:signal transduction histidine kinase
MSMDEDDHGSSLQPDNSRLTLKIDAHVVRQLGAELISGPEIALLELVKNSYDADAGYCYISINTDHSEFINGTNYEGLISVRDDGHGMSREVINRSWLTISHSEKRMAKANGVKSELHDRNFTGDKGLGRLGSMQLGRVCRIKTHSKIGEVGAQVYFDWDDVQQGRTLDSVLIYESEIPPQDKTGTQIEIVGLNDIEYWKTDKNLTKLKYQLSSMISPFGQLKDFKVYLAIDGISQELETFNEKIRSLCISQFSFMVQGNKVITEGELKLGNFIPSNPEDREYFEKYVNVDRGRNLFKYLGDDKTLTEYAQTYIESGPYFIKFRREIDVADISTTKRKLKRKGIVVDRNASEKISTFPHPGDFEGRIFQFAFVKENLSLNDISFMETKTLIQALTGGVSAFRDGFRIGSKRGDWLGLADEMTSGGGAYSLRPANTAGYINLTWENNSGLKEKSDRESFIENEAFEGFFIVCQDIIGSINGYLNKVRRASLHFVRTSRARDNHKPEEYSGKHAISELRTLTKDAHVIHEQVQRESEESKKSFQNSKLFLDQAIRENEESLFYDPKVTHLINDIKMKTAELESNFSRYAQNYEEFTRKLGDHIISVDKIRFEFESYEEQIKSFYDHVAIGLTAQALAHEANAQVNNIHIHVRSALARTKMLQIKDAILTKSLLSIRSDGQVLSKTLSSLNPLIRSHRNIIEELDLDDEIKSYLDLRASYFDAKNIRIARNCQGIVRKIKFNRGKLFQIIDNLVRNSEHWLEVYAAHFPDEELYIRIDLDEGTLSIWDSGRGIRPGMEDVLFDMFTTDKKSGQGLGLFIVKSLLAERDCTISLSPDRNRFGRRYKFDIDFRGAMD